MKRSTEEAGSDEESVSKPGARKRRSVRQRWLKDIDLSRAAENTLVGAVIFFGRYPVTFYHVLFKPGAMEDDLIFNPSYKNDAQVTFTRPVTFLVVSGFVYLAFAMVSTGTFIPIETIVQRFHWLIDRMPKRIEQLSLGVIAVFMVPFVLFVSLYACIAQLVFRVLGARLHFKIHLNIACYVVGVVAVLFIVLSTIEPAIWDLALGERRSWFTALPLFLLPIVLLGLLTLSLFRYLELIHRAAAMKWLRTLSGTVISISVFEAASWLLLHLATPLLQQLR